MLLFAIHMLKLAAQTSADPGAEPTLPPTGDIIETIDDSFDLGFWNTLIFAAVVAGITFIIIKILQKSIAKKLTGNSKIFYRLIYVVIIVIAVVIVLMTIKPLRDLGTAVVASSGIAAVVIGLAAQGTLGNLFSGISISMSKPFLVGEVIEVLNVTPPVTGRVQEVGLRHTIIRDTENKVIVIPNGVLDLEMLRTTPSPEDANLNNFLFIDIAFSSDIDKAIDIVRATAEAHENCLDMRTDEDKKNGAKKVEIYIVSFTDWSIKLRAGVWTKDVTTGFTTLSDLRYQVKKRFDEEGIEIPYPYQNVMLHTDNQYTHRQDGGIKQ